MYFPSGSSVLCPIGMGDIVIGLLMVCNMWFQFVKYCTLALLQNTNWFANVNIDIISSLISSIFSWDINHDFTHDSKDDTFVGITPIYSLMVTKYNHIHLTDWLSIQLLHSYLHCCFKEIAWIKLLYLCYECHNILLTIFTYFWYSLTFWFAKFSSCVRISEENCEIS